MDFLIVPDHVYGIKQISRLGRLLHVSPERLEELADEIGGHYRPYRRKKGSGGTRRIDNPDAKLKTVQRAIKSRVLAPLEDSFPPFMTGSISGRSTRNNAERHVGAETALVFDLRDCYGSISDGRVHSAWIRVFGCSPAIANLLTTLTARDKGLPQGAPTSPALANIILFEMLTDINSLAEDRGLHFSMFADDGTASGPAEFLYPAAPEILDLVRRHGYKLAFKKKDGSSTKTRVLKRGRDRMTTTGLDFSSGVKPPRAYVQDLRAHILAEFRATSQCSPSVQGSVNYVRTFDAKAAAKLESLIMRLSTPQLIV